MKPKNAIKIRFQRAAANTNPQMDKVVLEDVLTAYKKTLGRKSTNPQFQIWRIIKKSRITKKAPVALVLLAFLIGLMYWLPSGEKQKTITENEEIETPAAFGTRGSVGPPKTPTSRAVVLKGSTTPNAPGRAIQPKSPIAAVAPVDRDRTRSRAPTNKTLSIQPKQAASGSEAGLPGVLDAEQTVAKSPLIYKLRLTRVLEDLQGKVFRHNDTAEREILIEAEVLRVFKGDSKAAGQRVVLVWDTVRSGPRLYSCVHAEQVLPKHAGSAEAVYLMALTPAEPTTDAEGRPRLKNIFCLDIMGTRVSKADVDPQKWVTAKNTLERLKLELLSAMDDPDANTRHSAIKGLRTWDGQKLTEEPPAGPLWKDERAAARILAASRDPDWRVRWVVAWMIPKEAGEEGEKALIRLLSDTHREVRQVAAFVMRRRGREDLVKPLLDEPLAREATWGEAVEGVQVRLRVDKAVWESGKVPTFHADVRNNGEREIVLPISEHGWGLEFNGEWYESRALVIVGLRKLPPGEEYCGVKISLGSWWLRTKNLRERIQLTPGKHTVRVGCYAKRDSGSGVRAISNSVEIDILAKDEKDDVVDVATTKATLVEWLVSEGGNGHFYEAIAVPGGISWTDATEAANLKGGYLVTITSQAENDFVHDLINDALYWDGPCGPWIGGYQPEGSPEPAGGWRWVTDEPFLYSNWNNQQPNEFHGNNENRIHFGYIARTPFWNDVPDTAVTEDGRRIRGYIVETIPATAVGAGGAEPDDPTPPVRPLSGRELDGKEILKKLKSSDAVYKAAFTASGSRPGWPIKKWKLTMLHGEIVYQEEVIDIPKPPEDRMGRWIPFRRTYYVGPTVQAEHDWVGRIRRYGPLDPWPENNPGPATSGVLGVVKPDAPTYMLLIKRPLLCLGRGYSRYVTEIKDASRQDDGRLKVTADGIDIAYRPGAKWELVIAPDAAYMVRSAKMVDSRNLSMSISNSGLKWYGSRCVPEKAECKGKYMDASFEIQSASSEADSEFLKHAKDTMRPPYLIHTDIKDKRVSPGLYLSYDAGKVSPNGKIKDWDIGFEDPKQPATQWGEPVEGVQVRLRAKGATTAKRVTLLADARNDGPGTYRGTRSTHGCWLKVDGKWYGRVQTRESVAPMLLKAGDRQLAFTQIRLGSEKSHLWRGGFITRNGQVPSLGAREIHQSEPLELSPGRHTVCLAFPASRKAYAYSNAVEIEILPAEEMPALQVEMGALSFCSVVECVLSEQSMHYSIDLDTGKTVEQAAKPGRTGLEGMDAHVVIKDDKRGLQFHEVFAGYQRGIAAEKTWEEKTAQELSKSLHDATWGKMRMPIRDHFPWEEMSQRYLTAEDELPMTLVFMTRHGTKGLLQLIEFTNNPKGVKIRYKLIKQIDNDRKTAVQVETEEIEKTDSLVWGKEVNGLRAAVEFVPEKGSYEQGEVVGIRFHLQNVSNQIINLSTPRWWIQGRCFAEDQLGIKMPERTVPEPWGMTTIDRHKLLPGRVIKLESGSLAIAKDKTQRNSLCKYPFRNIVTLKPGRYSLYYWLRFPGMTRLDGDGKV